MGREARRGETRHRRGGCLRQARGRPRSMRRSVGPVPATLSDCVPVVSQTESCFWCGRRASDAHALSGAAPADHRPPRDQTTS